MAGPVITSAPSATTPTGKVMPFKQPFKTVATLSAKTGNITKPIDPAISKTIDFVYNGYSVRVLCSGGEGVVREWGGHGREKGPRMC